MGRSRLAQMFFENAKEMPNKIAIWCDGATKTYSQMADFVNQYSNFLLANGVQYGDHIAIPMNNSIESVALFFSAAELGVCLVPLNPTLPLEAILNAMSTGDIKHIIARKSFFNECDKQGGVAVEGVKICLDGEYLNTVAFSSIENFSTDRPIIDNIKGDESLILTMTSGSTGKPKPIDISQQNKIDRSLAHIRVYGLTKEDRILAATPLYHSLAERLVILPLILGATSILLPRFTPAMWLNCANEQKPTFTIAVSAQLAQILELLQQSDAPSIESFRSIVSSSALLEEKVKMQLIDKLKCEFNEMYGTSETSTITNICFQKVVNKQKSVGLPFDEAQIRIWDEDDGRDCIVGEVGEIICKSSLTCKGYYKQEALMNTATIDGYFRTGDLGYLDEDGYLYFSGRKKELIITGAINVYPRDIDEIVSRIYEVEECAAFPYPDDKLGEVVALAVVAKEGCEIKQRTIKTYCARNLADFQQPHKIFFVDSLPKNTLGKLQRMNILEYIRDLGLDE